MYNVMSIIMSAKLITFKLEKRPIRGSLSQNSFSKNYNAIIK